jgi:hypothetical protein
MFRWLSRWWKSRQRKIDLQILWPTFKEQADDLAGARAAFMAHMSFDSAYEGMTQKELDDFIKENLV